MAGGRFKELLKKYGKVALGVHFSVSAASISGLYIAVKNNVDVETILEKFGMPSLVKEKEPEITDLPSTHDLVIVDDDEKIVGNDVVVVKEKNKTTELAATSGGALALAVLINKALFPVRVPVTMVLTPPIARFLARRNLIKTGL